MTAAEVAATGPVVASSRTHTLDSLDVLNVENAQVAIQALDDAIASVDSTRADLGAVQNRFESTISNLQNISENASNARGRIMDTTTQPSLPTWPRTRSCSRLVLRCWLRPTNCRKQSSACWAKVS